MAIFERDGRNGNFRVHLNSKCTRAVFAVYVYCMHISFGHYIYGC